MPTSCLWKSIVLAAFVTKIVSCCRPMACSWRTALQWRCAHLCVRCSRTALLKMLVWLQVRHPHPLYRPCTWFHIRAKSSDLISPFWLTDLYHTLHTTHMHTLMHKHNVKPCWFLVIDEFLFFASSLQEILSSLSTGSALKDRLISRYLIW